MYVYRSPNGFYFEAGVQPGFLVAEKDKYDGESMDYKDYINGFEVGVVGGVGYALNEQFSASGRVVYGLTNINKETDDMYASEDKDHNLFVGLIVHWLMPTKGRQ